MTPLNELRSIRQRHAYSIRALATDAGVSPATVLRAEKGEAIHPSTVRKLAQALGVTPAELRGGAPAPAPATPAARPPGMTPERARELAARYRAEGDRDEADHWERIAQRVAASAGSVE